MSRHSPADDAQFQANCGSSVISNRNHGLLRGVAVGESYNVLKTYAKHKRAISPSIQESDESTANSSETPEKNKSISEEDMIKLMMSR